MLSQSDPFSLNIFGSKRLLSLAAEKFVSDIATDAFQYARIRTNAGPGRQRAGASGARVS